MSHMEHAIAHHRKSDGQDQTLENHLQGVARQAKRFADKLQLAQLGEILGLLHDLGKYSAEFQIYLRNAIRAHLRQQEGDGFDPDCDTIIARRGSVDHSTAGALLAWNWSQEKGPCGPLVGQIIALCLSSHHSGLIDCLRSCDSKPVEDHFSRRMAKEEKQTHLDEVQGKIDPKILAQLQAYMADGLWFGKLTKILQNIAQGDRGKPFVIQQKMGLLVRFLLKLFDRCRPYR